MKPKRYKSVLRMLWGIGAYRAWVRLLLAKIGKDTTKKEKGV